MEIENLIKNKVAFHCLYNYEAYEFFRKACNLGYKWKNNNYNYDNSYYNCYEENTCYILNKDKKTILLLNLQNCKKYGYTIIKYEIDEETKNSQNVYDNLLLMNELDVKFNEKFNIIDTNDGLYLSSNSFYFDENGKLILDDDINYTLDNVIYNLKNGQYIIDKRLDVAINMDLINKLNINRKNLTDILMLTEDLKYKTDNLKCFVYHFCNEFEDEYNSLLERYQNIINSIDKLNTECKLLTTLIEKHDIK